MIDFGASLRNFSRLAGRRLAAVGSDQRVEICPSRLLAVFRAMQRAVRYPGDTARISGGSAEYLLLFDDQRRTTERLGRKRGRHRPGTAAHDYQIEALVRMPYPSQSMALEVLQAGGTLLYPESPALDTVCDSIVEAARQPNQYVGARNLPGCAPRLRLAGIDVEGVEQVYAPPARAQRQPDPARSGAANMLGMTESFGRHSSEPLDTVLPAHRAGSSGRATSDYERRVVDPATGEVLGPGRSGELQLRGGGLMKGYYKVDPRQVFTADGFYPTGDIVRIEEDGHLFFQERRGDTLKTSGTNVSRLEVEAALRALPEVALPIVVGLPDAEIGQ